MSLETLQHEMGLVVHVVGRQGCTAMFSLSQFHLKLPTSSEDTTHAAAHQQR